MSGPRDALGLLLPLPALLLAGSAEARVEPPAPQGEEQRAVEPPLVDDAEAQARRLDELESLSVDERQRAKAAFQRGHEAFTLGYYYEAAQAFEESARLATGMPALHLYAATAFRHAAVAELHPSLAAELCEATQRHADAVVAHPQATAGQREDARAEQQQAQAHCDALHENLGPCLSVVGPCLQPPLGPCLSIIDNPRGCSHHEGDGSVAMLGTLALLGLRTRRRRDAVERLAERLPPDVVAKLRRAGDGDEPDPDR